MKLELSVYASNLKNVARLGGTSDPFAVVTLMAAEPGKKPEVLGKTEVINNTLSPQWVKVFLLDYELGTPCKVAVSVFDEVRKGDNKPMGTTVFDVAELLGARGNTKAKKLRQGGTLFATVRKSRGSGLLRLKMKGTKLKNVEGMFSKSDPFFELSKRVDSAGGLTWDNVYRSKPIQNNLNPNWEAVVIDLSILCDGELDKPILVTVFDFERSGKHVPMGKFETNVKGFQQAAASGQPFKLTEKNKEVGSITIEKAEVNGVEEMTSDIQRMGVSHDVAPSAPLAAVAATAPVNGSPNFVDYISGGCQLNVVVAIDFTGSNGDPRIPGTLHHRDPTGATRNDYEKAISAILNVLSKYDSDQMYPVLGFGAKYDGVVRHCFQCGPSPEVRGIQGVLDAYHNVFSSGLIMSKPTVFNEVIETAAAQARSSLDAALSRGEQSYTILLIMTDGAVADVRATADCLDRVSDSPLSIVIVGIGNDDFGPMQFLDDAAKPGKRDIAQFVEFNKHRNNSVALTSETLNEIPDQLTGFFQSRRIAPLPPLKRSGSSMSIDDADEHEVDLSLDVGEHEIVVTSGGHDHVDGFQAARSQSNGL